MKARESASFGELLKKFRTDPMRWDEKPPSQAKLADWAHVSVDTIGAYEQNKRFPGPGVLEALAKALKLTEAEQSELASALRSTKKAPHERIASDTAQTTTFPPANDETVTSMPRDPTEASTLPRMERRPISRRVLFEAVRRRRAIYLVIAVVVLSMLAIFVFMTTLWAKSNKVTISGKVLCIDDERVVGVWVLAINGGSNFAKWYKTNDNGSEAAFSYDLPNGGAYNIHVGCGGSRQDWANTDNTENGSGTIKDHTSHYITCQDVPLVAGHGPCYLKR